MITRKMTGLANLHVFFHEIVTMRKQMCQYFQAMDRIESSVFHEVFTEKREKIWNWPCFPALAEIA